MSSAQAATSGASAARIGATTQSTPATTNVTAEFSIVPVVEGTMRDWIDEALGPVRRRGLAFAVNPIGTTIEGPLPEIFAAVAEAHELLMAHGPERLVTLLRIDDRPGGTQPHEPLARARPELTAGTRGDLRGIEFVRDYLDTRSVRYRVIKHSEHFTAASEAEAAGVAPHHAAKAVALRCGDDYYRLAVVRASDTLDLNKARDLLGLDKRLRLATEAELAEAFPEFELGALPPFTAGHTPEIVDRHLFEFDEIVCSGGDHRHSIALDPNEIVRVARPRIADIRTD